MSGLQEIKVTTNSREELLDITAKVKEAVNKLNISQGMVMVYVPHTTAGVLINENADPAVGDDILKFLRSRVPRNDGYRHGEGNSDAHIKAMMVGTSQLLLVNNGNPVLGTWQGIYFAEFDGPRQRRVFVGR